MTTWSIHNHGSDDAAAALRTLLTSCPWLFDVLGVVRDVGDQFGLSCWVGAGAVPDLVWDSWYGAGSPRDPADFDGAAVKDVEVVFFDAARPDPSIERHVEVTLARRRPDVEWDVTNQAIVHLWYEDRFGFAVEPLVSIADAVGTWPETATTVAVARTLTETIDIVAPLGLHDLLVGVRRRNARRVGIDEYRRRLQRLQPTKRWPGVTVHTE